MTVYLKHVITVKLTPDQRSKVGRAARMESRRRGQTVTMSALLREVAMPPIEQIIAQSQPQQHAPQNV